MYFLSPEESKMLQKDLIPRARESGVAAELRGWNWHEAPLKPPYEVGLALHEVAGKYCPTGRDTYLRRVCGVKSVPGKAMLSGLAYHSAVVQTIQEAKRLIYALGPGGVSDIARGLRVFEPSLDVRSRSSRASLTEDAAKDLENGASRAAGSTPTETSDDAVDKTIKDGMRKIKVFEEARIIGRIEEVLSKQPYISADSLAATALPVTCEHRLDGSFLGLSSLLSCDAASLGGAVIFDLKFGRKRDFHRLSTSGYALVMESLWDFPVDIGCTVYVDMRHEVPGVTRDLYVISDELRQWFIDERDDKMSMVSQETDPGVAEECYEYCEFRGRCGGDSTRAGEL